HVPINVNVPVRQPLRDARDRFVNTRMDAEGERGAVCCNVIEQLIEFTCAPPHHMQNRAEYFFLQFARAIEFDDGRRYIRATLREPSIEPEQYGTPRFHCRHPPIELVLCLTVDHRTDVS